MIQISLNKEDVLELVQIVNCKAGEGELVGWQADYWCEKEGFKWQVTLRLGDMDISEVMAKTKITVGEMQDSELFYEYFASGNNNSKKTLDKELEKE